MFREKKIARRTDKKKGIIDRFNSFYNYEKIFDNLKNKAMYFYFLNKKLELYLIKDLPLKHQLLLEGTPNNLDYAKTFFLKLLVKKSKI